MEVLCLLGMLLLLRTMEESHNCDSVSSVTNHVVVLKSVELNVDIKTSIRTKLKRSTPLLDFP